MNIKLTRRDFIQHSSMAAAGGVLTSSATGQAAASASRPPNILWLIGDDVGPHEFGCYGHPSIRTPNVDRLARGGTPFSRAFVTTSSCSPSRASMFTGKFPHNTGAENLHAPLPADQPILVDHLAEKNYWCANAGKCHLGKAAEGKFDAFVNNPDKAYALLRERPKDQPFFLAVGYHDAHRPFDRGAVSPAYTPDDIVVPPYLPDTPEVREDLAGFYDEISHMDERIGRLLASLEEEGSLANTLVVFAGDNGMPFPRAKTTLYDSGIATPLVMHWPAGLARGQMYEGLVSLVDLVPTMLEAAGIGKPEGLPGISLFEQMENPASHRYRFIYAEKNWHDFEDHSRAIRTRRLKYIWNAFPEDPLLPPADAIRSPTYAAMQRMRDAGTLSPEAMQQFRMQRPAEELYDLALDPMEFRNVAEDPAYSMAVQELRARLERWRQETEDVPAKKLRPDEFHPVTGERIRERKQY